VKEQKKQDVWKYKLLMTPQKSWELNNSGEKCTRAYVSPEQLPSISKLCSQLKNMHISVQKSGDSDIGDQKAPIKDSNGFDQYDIQVSQFSINKKLLAEFS